MLRCQIPRLALLVALVAALTLGLAAVSAHAAMGDQEIERLIQEAATAAGAKRLQAVEALGNSADLRALQPLLGLLDDADPSIREHALKALQTLAQSLRQISSHLASWIDRIMLWLDIYLAPEPPVERTQHKRLI